MARTRIEPYEEAGQALSIIASPGALLVAGRGKPNPMTIGWGQLGPVWGKPVFAALVRPSRHTHKLLLEHGEFTVNVPGDALADALELCGTKSGRDVDKIAAAGLSLVSGETVAVPSLAGARYVYECRVVHRTEMIPANADAAVIGSFYPRGDWHAVFHGIVLAAFRED